MAKLSDKQRKKILAEYIEGGTSLRKLAKKYGCSTYLIKTILDSDKNLEQKITHKKEENVQSVLAFMDSKKNDVCGLIEKLLVAMNDPQKIAATPLSQLATAMGIVIDKYTATENLKPLDSRANNLFAAMDAWEEDDFNDLPEVQQASECSAEMVENDGTQK